MSANLTDLLSDLEERGLRLVVEAGSLKLRGPAEHMPGPEVIEKLRHSKTEIVEELYHELRAQRTLREMCRDYEEGTILWLEANAPLLYEAVTAILPNRVSQLWEQHARAESLTPRLRNCSKRIGGRSQCAGRRGGYMTEVGTVEVVCGTCRFAIRPTGVARFSRRKACELRKRRALHAALGTESACRWSNARH